MASAVLLALGAAQFASGRDLESRPAFPGAADASPGAVGASVNRSAKADRAAGLPGSLATSTRTISLRLDSLSDTSILLRVPALREARNSSFVPLLTKPSDRKATMACEGVVSVLTEVARQLQPGRCVT